MTLTLPPRDGLVALPASAVHGLDRVYRLDDENRLQTVAVSRIGEWQGADGEQRLLFKGDFKVGDRLVINQLPGAIDGLRVQPAEGGQTPQGLQPASPEPAAEEPQIQ